MGSPDHSDPIEQAALYAAGALPQDEAAAFERRLAEGDEASLRELSRLDPVMAELFLAIPPVTPSPRVRAEVLRGAEVIVRRRDEGGWEPLRSPGIFKRMLHQDRARNRTTFLLRMEAGSLLPEHPHAGVEECFVLEGDVESMGYAMRAGDYFRADAGTRHGESRTREGCLLLIQAAGGEEFGAEE